MDFEWLCRNVERRPLQGRPSSTTSVLRQCVLMQRGYPSSFLKPPNGIKYLRCWRSVLFSRRASSQALCPQGGKHAFCPHYGPCIIDICEFQAAVYPTWPQELANSHCEKAWKVQPSYCSVLVDQEKRSIIRRSLKFSYSCHGVKRELILKLPVSN